jgi:Trypsin
MMKKLTLVFVFVLALSLLVVGVAYAVTNGQPDGNNHPYVGLLVFDDANGPAWRCSGSLIAPNVVLTAGHCTDGAVKARIWFASDVSNNPDYPAGGPSAIEGTPSTYPGFCIQCGNGLPGFAQGDVGIVVLSKDVTDVGFAALPTAGYVDTLAMKSPVDIVGYGVQFQITGGGPPRWGGPRIRMFAPSDLVASNDVIASSFIKMTANPAQGKGGTCFGDSGGADFEGGTNIALAVNSFVTNSNCTGVTYSFRVDQPDVLDWIGGFLK